MSTQWILEVTAAAEVIPGEPQCEDDSAEADEKEQS